MTLEILKGELQYQAALVLLGVYNKTSIQEIFDKIMSFGVYNDEFIDIQYPSSEDTSDFIKAFKAALNILKIEAPINKAEAVRIIFKYHADTRQPGTGLVSLDSIGVTLIPFREEEIVESDKAAAEIVCKYYLEQIALGKVDPLDGLLNLIEDVSWSYFFAQSDDFETNEFASAYLTYMDHLESISYLKQGRPDLATETPLTEQEFVDLKKEILEKAQGWINKHGIL